MDCISFESLLYVYMCVPFSRTIVKAIFSFLVEFNLTLFFSFFSSISLCLIEQSCLSKDWFLLVLFW